MNYLVQVRDSLHEVSVEERGDREYSVTVGDRTYRVDLQRIGQEPLYSMLVDGESHEVHAGGGPNTFEVLLEGALFTVNVTARTGTAGALPRGGQTVQAGPLEIQAPMPGVVHEVYVRPGQAVEHRERLLVLEAMKMNNEIHAPRAGVIRAVPVTPGQRVNKGDVLVVLA